MVRRRWLIGQIAFVALLAVLALPSSGSALSAVFISLTPTGPSPAVLTISAGLYPVWINQDTVTHTVTFANGCSIQVAPGGYGQCTNGFSGVVGDYAYTVDGTAQASIVVTAEGRTVTLTARRHTIKRGSARAARSAPSNAMVTIEATRSPASSQPVSSLPAGTTAPTRVNHASATGG